MLKIKNINEFVLIKEANQSLKLNVPKDVLDLHSLFKKNKRELYVVGGAVRDALLGQKPKDFDLATDAKPEEVVKILKSGGVETIGEVGQAFGVVIAKTPDFPEGMEIATFREDIGSGRRPDAVKFSTIDKDVLRRDLTINALFYDIDRGEVVDLVGGVADIMSNTIRTVGQAQLRFDEDRLRVLRALRFAGRTGSKLEKDTAAAIQADNNLDGVSAERIRDEFKKSIESAKKVIDYLKMVEEFRLWEIMFPNININKNFTNEASWFLQIAQLFMKNETDVIKKQLNKMTFTNDEINSIIFLKDFMDIEPLTAFDLHKKWQNTVIDRKDLLTFSKRNKLDMKVVKAFIKYKPSIKGGEVVKRFNLKGPEISNKIKELEAEKFSELI